jgi:hypothetical protein
MKFLLCQNIEHMRHWLVSKVSQISIKKSRGPKCLKKLFSFLLLLNSLTYLRVNGRHFHKIHLKRYTSKNKYSSPIMDVKLSFYYLIGSIFYFEMLVTLMQLMPS